MSSPFPRKPSYEFDPETEFLIRRYLARVKALLRMASYSGDDYAEAEFMVKESEHLAQALKDAPLVGAEALR